MRSEYIRFPLRYSIILITKDRLTSLITNLDHINALTPKPLHVTVIDASKVEVSELNFLAKELLCGIDFTYVHTDIASTSHQRNIGLNIENTIKSNYILFLDDDTFPNPDYVSLLYDSIVTHNAIGAMGIEHPLPLTPSKIKKWLKNFALIENNTPGSITKSGSNTPPNDYSQVYFVDWLWACSLWDKKAIAGLKFPTLYRGYVLGEDVIFSVNASKRGKLIFNPNARLFHQKTSNSSLIRKVKYCIKRIRFRFEVIKIIKIKPINILAYIWTTAIEMTHVGVRTFFGLLIITLNRLANYLKKRV